MRDKDKFKVGDLVRWEPSKYDLKKGDTSDTGVVVKVGFGKIRTYDVDSHYACIEWIDLGDGMIIARDESWDKTCILARANNV
jgi:hypothetical protein